MQQPLNSSTGFNKRPMLRPPSGIINREKDFLKSVDLSQSDLTIASLLRSEMALVQQEVNLLDKDRRLRTSEATLSKSHVGAMKKWLRECQQLTEKEDDETRVLKFMNSESFQAGFRKLWKVVSVMDLMLCKATQLQLVQFLLYDEMYESVCEDSPRAQGIMQSIGKAGFNIGTHRMTQLLLERQKDLYEKISALKRKGTTVGAEQKSPPDVKVDTSNETKELIAQMRLENERLSQTIEEMQRSQKQLIKATKEEKAPQSSDSVATARPTKSSIQDLENRYRDQINGLTETVKSLRTQLLETHTKLGVVQGDLVSQKAISLTPQGTRPKPGSYEETLLEEMEKMKTGFERRMKQLGDDYSAKEREMRKRELDMKTQNERNKWEKSLLLKKYEALTAK